MSAQTLAQLLAPKTEAQFLSQLLLQMQSGNLPVSDWASGGVERTILQSDSFSLADVAQAIVAIAGGGLVDYATIDWLELIAEQLYLITRNAAVFTQGNITLTSPSGSVGPYTIAVNQLWAIGAGGNRYTNITGGTLSTSSSLTLLWQAESAGAKYNDGAGTITTLVTPLAGVTLNNPAPTFSPTIQTGSGEGTVTPSGAPGSNHSVIVRIDVGGQTGAASWSYSIDGAAFVSAGAVSSASNIGSTGITVTLANGAINPSFVLGDTYTFQNPGSWITQSGTDIESRASLQERCKARWPDLGAIPTDSKYVLWVKAASTQVTQVLVEVDGTINNKVNITIAGGSGPLPSNVVSTVQGYLNARVDLTDLPVVASAIATAITLGGTITVSAAKLTSAQTAVQQAIANYISSSAIAGTIELSEVISLFRNPYAGVEGQSDPTAGVLSVSVPTVTINGSATDLVLASGHVATFTQVLSSSLTWIPV